MNSTTASALLKAGCTIQSVLKLCIEHLRRIDQKCAQFEAEIIVESVCGCTRQQLYLDSHRTVSPLQQKSVECILRRRDCGEPLPYILQKAYFYNREFSIDTSVLIPRSETEVLVDIVLKNEPNESYTFCDMCTGSGILYSILKEHRSRWNGIAVDISLPALRVARRNCPDGAVVCSDLFTALKNIKRLDILICNPPYIAQDEYYGLDQSVRKHEPVGALLGGKDGLDFFRRIARETAGIVQTGSRLYCETGVSQALSVSALLRECGWRDIECFPDLAGRDRVIRAEWC
jgi:release factor glutamine methyltransferase